jgi:hypothetical protein
MPNHWHFVFWPRKNGELSEFMRWLTVTHTQRWHVAHRTAGTGPLYQGRFKSFPIQEDDHLWTVLCYVERNPLRANLVDTTVNPLLFRRQEIDETENECDKAGRGLWETCTDVNVLGKLAYLIKISRRFVSIQPWLPQFCELAADAPTTIGVGDTVFGGYLGRVVYPRSPPTHPATSRTSSAVSPNPLAPSQRFHFSAAPVTSTVGNSSGTALPTRAATASRPSNRAFSIHCRTLACEPICSRRQ